ncbi:pteridine reductase [Alteromonadaceae bacterium Bs31]|nr:pteridine reductase [Alteromonadaceae bacterium Bs31]
MSEYDKPIKVALVTGGARRIGAVIAKRLHSDGYNIALHYNKSEHAAKTLAAALNAQRANSTAVFHAGLNSVSDVEHLANAVVQHFSGCNLLVNNASSFFPTPPGQFTEQQWDELFASNTKAPLFLAQALQSELKKQQGSIINIADIYAERPMKNHTIYCMAKAANVMMTKSLALELAPEIKVNSVAPGAAMWPEDDEGNQIENPELLNAIPLRKLGGAEAIAAAVAFLAQADNYITGQVLNVDGGRSLSQ